MQQAFELAASVQRGGVEVLSDLRVTKPFPSRSEQRKSMETDLPRFLFELYVQGAQEIQLADVLSVGTQQLFVVSCALWAYNGLQVTQLVLEDLYKTLTDSVSVWRSVEVDNGVGGVTSTPGLVGTWKGAIGATGQSPDSGILAQRLGVLVTVPVYMETGADVKAGDELHIGSRVLLVRALAITTWQVTIKAICTEVV